MKMSRSRSRHSDELNASVNERLLVVPGCPEIPRMVDVGFTPWLRIMMLIVGEERHRPIECKILQWVGVPKPSQDCTV
jgi:hypothetical protein